MKLTDFIICDDIRQEVGDKLSLMGILGDAVTIQIPKGAPRPVPFRLAVFFRVVIEEGDTVPDSASLVFTAEGQVVAAVGGVLGIEGKPKILGFPTPAIIIPIMEDTTLSVRAVFSTEGKTISEVAPAYDITIQIIEV